MLDVRKLQVSLGFTGRDVDGIAGIGTYTALFTRCGAGQTRAADLAVAANRFFAEYGVMDSPLRLAHLMAQLMHESASFFYMEEIASGAAYEGREDLGNVVKGDGVRFKGRGPIQITGRANYRRFGRAIGIDLERNPTIAAVPSIGLHLALEYWKVHDLNRWADADDVVTITRKINGGTNGLADRKKHLAEVKRWLT